VSSVSNTDRLRAAGLIADPSLLPEAHVSFLTDELTADDIDALLAIKAKLDRAGIPVLPYPPHLCMPIF
jgi:hypothetical protein